MVKQTLKGSQHTLNLEEALKGRIDHSGSKTKIEFLGFKADPRPYYAAADWHFAPSICKEPLGNVVQEAKQMKNPSVVSNNGGLLELIEHGKDGFILNDVNAKELASTIKKLYKIEAGWRSMDDDANASLHRPFSHETFDHQWSDVVLSTSKKSYEQH